MSRQLIGILVASVGGVIAGAAGSWVTAEARATKKYEEKVALMQGAYESALELQMKKPVIDIFQAPDTDGDSEMIRAGMSGEVVEIKASSLIPEQRDAPHVERIPGGNQYHSAIEATETPVDVFVGGETNAYGVAYIEEEDYLDEDGRFKGKVDIMMVDGDPIFLMDGEPMENWADKLGGSILVDFFKLVPPGIDPILYVRNHRTDEDYEVVQVSP